VDSLHKAGHDESKEHDTWLKSASHARRIRHRGDDRKWFKQPGDPVAVDEPLVELETDKVTIEVPAPAAGTLGEIAANNGETVAVGALLGRSRTARARREAAPPPGPRPRSPSLRRVLRRRRKVVASDAPLAPSVRKLAAEPGWTPPRSTAAARTAASPRAT
jgi:pyruvate/2-oxoglutarate dehydrogenase complex dihydrolipoamide acyltransferase (E2) component